jgi:membrane-associated phospholipid phosphatase
VSSISVPERHVDDAERPSLRSTWPLERRDWIDFTIALVATIGVFAAVGWVAFDAMAPNAVTDWDQDVAEWFADGRTALGDDLAHWGAFLASTEVKIGATALFALFALWHWRRWPEPLMVVSTLVFEATAFIVVTTIVGRARPDVPRLEDSPVNSSFPSGHVAAAAVYGAFAVVVFWNTRSRVARSAAVTVVVLVTATVAWARMYQGMHFATDVAAGVVLGIVSLLVCISVVGRPEPADSRGLGVGTPETRP